MLEKREFLVKAMLLALISVKTVQLVETVMLLLMILLAMLLLLAFIVASIIVKLASFCKLVLASAS